MKVLVTGGTVFASRYTAEYFVSKGHEVYVMNRNTRPQSQGVKLIDCDRHEIGERLKNMSFDLVIDVTAYNEADVASLLDALGSFGEYVLISSSAVYPETNPMPFLEEQTCGENSYWGQYGTDKIAAEKYVLEHVPQAYILRPPYLYGPMNNVYREAFVFECAEKNLPFYVPRDGKMPLQFFYIGDMCRFIEILMKEKPKQRIYNVGNSTTVSIEEWVRLCYEVLGKTPEIRYVTENHVQRDYFSFHDYAYRLDVTKQNSLMPDVKPLKEGLKEAYAWYKNNRELVVRKQYLDYIKEHF